MNELMMMMAAMGMLEDLEEIDTVCPVCGKQRTVCGADFEDFTMSAMVCTECNNIIAFDKDGTTVTMGIDSSIAELVKQTLIERGEVVEVKHIEEEEEEETEEEMSIMSIIDALLDSECDCENCDETNCAHHPSNQE